MRIKILYLLTFLIKIFFKLNKFYYTISLKFYIFFFSRSLLIITSLFQLYTIGWLLLSFVYCLIRSKWLMFKIYRRVLMKWLSCFHFPPNVFIFPLSFSDVVCQNHIFANAFHLCRICLEVLDKFVECREVPCLGPTNGNEVLASMVYGNVSEFRFGIRCSHADVEFVHIQSRADQKCPFVVRGVQHFLGFSAGNWTVEPGTGIELNERKELLVIYHTRLEVLEAGSG